ncbi:MAG: hypothetical protein N3G22_01310 [Candidatus Micrarchaeota archaeon]|nr:hypothetical protein [Candidatus Micrarchaeota archaeon]
MGFVQKAAVALIFFASLLYPSPEDKILFSQNISYTGGFAREFAVYSPLPQFSATPSPYTKIVVSYTNGKEPLQDVVLYEQIPPSITRYRSRIFFQDAPAVISAQENVSFGWRIRSLAPGESVSFTYFINSQLDEKMMRKFGRPQIQPANNSSAATQEPKENPIAAAMLSLPYGLEQILLAAAVLFVLIFLIVLARSIKVVR